MNIRSVLTILTAILLVFFSIIRTEAKEKGVEKIESATEILSGIMSIPEKEIPPTLLRNAYGIAVIPEVIKVGLVIGGRHGKGILVVRTGKNDWSNPVFISFTGGSIGWQIGAQSTDVILVFKNRKSIDGIMKGKFTLGADASVAAGPVGRHAEAATDTEMKAEIYSYSQSRGLFAGVSLEGAALRIDDQGNADFYSKEDIKPQDIFSDNRLKTPPAAARFRQVLERSQQ